VEGEPLNDNQSQGSQGKTALKDSVSKIQMELGVIAKIEMTQEGKAGN
jgi:hypothetical protein